MTARLQYSSGWVLTIPANGYAPRLFLEWIAQQQHDAMQRNSPHPYITYKIGTFREKDDIESFFRIRLQNCIRQDHHDLTDYINANS